MLWLFVGPTGVCLLDFFCSGVRFGLLLSPCPCFVSLLYLGLCVLGDGALVGWGSFVRARYLCVLVRIWIEGGVGAVEPVWALRWSVLLTVPGRCFFCGSFVFLFCLVFAVFCARLFVCSLWSPAGRGLASWLSFVVSSVSLSLSHWYPGSGVVLDCIDS